jgi:hypothetical protein
MRDLVPFTSGVVALTALATSFSLACGPREPRTDAERLARGREIIERMSAKLAAAPVFSVTTAEVRDEIRSSGASEQVTLTRATVVRRPDRFYSVVTGGRHNEVWYDGVGLTLVLHNEKVFAQSARQKQSTRHSTPSMKGTVSRRQSPITSTRHRPRRCSRRRRRAVGSDAKQPVSSSSIIWHSRIRVSTGTSGFLRLEIPCLRGR